MTFRSCFNVNLLAILQERDVEVAHLFCRVNRLEKQLLPYSTKHSTHKKNQISGTIN